jgi:hypothetical protein
MAHAVSRRLLIAEARVRAQVRPCGIFMGKVALEQVSLRVLRFPPVSVIPPLFHIHLCVIWGMNKGPVSGQVSQGHSLIPSQE